MNKRMLLAALAAVLAMPLAASANLILNGGFEIPVTSPPFQYRTGTQITDWTITTSHKGVAQFDSSYRPVGADNYSVQIESGGPSPDSISQTVGTVPGATYFVSFLLSAYDAGGASMDVTIDGFAQNYTSFSQSYTSYTFSFVADDLVATLKFENAGAYAVSYPQIDSVSMVPEPTTMVAGALLLLPFGASTIRKLRKKRLA